SAPDAELLQSSGVDAFHLPNAFDHRSSVEQCTLRATSFIGARYANREEALLSLHNAGIPVVAFGKTWSSRLVDRVRTRRMRTMPFVTDRKSTRLNSSHVSISYAVFCLKKKT